MCVFHYISYSIATAQSVSVESSQQPSCPNETHFFNCSVLFPSFFILWNHKAFAPISLTGVTTFVGNSTSASNGRAVAELTMREAVGNGL